MSNRNVTLNLIRQIEDAAAPGHVEVSIEVVRELAHHIRAMDADSENLRIHVARWTNERRGERNSALLEIHERNIIRALDRLDPTWREKP